MSADPILLSRHENGPVGSGQGGIAAGRFAACVDPRRAAVRLHAPVPLETPMHGSASDQGGVEVRSPDRLIGTVRALDEPIEARSRDWVDDDTVVAASARSFAHDIHGPYATCYGCGHARSDDRGLGLLPGPIDGTERYVTAWTPPGDGPVPTWMVWAALDCPSGAPVVDAATRGETAVTGELAADIGHEVMGGRPHQIHSGQIERSGRKVTTESVLVDRDGTALAAARAIWILVADRDTGSGSG